MPQIEDLGATDELIAFKDEGDQPDKRSEACARDLDDVKSALLHETERDLLHETERDLDDVKSALVHETESSSDSEADRRSRTDADLQNRIRHSHLIQEALRRQQDGGLFQPSPYVGYPFFMIPDLGNLCGPYLANAALPPSARPYLPFQWPLLDVTGRAAIRDTAAHTHLPPSAGQHPMTHLHPLLSYSPEAFSPQRASPGFSPDSGLSRSPCYPASPGGMAQIPHPLGWLQGQAMYPLAGGFSPAALAMNASMSSLVSGSFSPRLVPSPQPPGAHGHAPFLTSVKQEPGASSQTGRSLPEVQRDREEEKKPHIKKPLNAFMLYMREERPHVVEQCRVKESATINQILGQRWHSLSKEEQAKYYDLARKERLLHSKLYPGWSARDNYGKKKKRKRAKSETQFEDEEDFPSHLKRPPAPHTHSVLTQTTQSRSHLTHTHLSQASPASSLDSPATPTTALASPAAPAPTHTEHTHRYGGGASPYGGGASPYGGGASPYAEQLQPLALTTKTHRPARPLGRSTGTPRPCTPRPCTPRPCTPSSSCDSPSPHTAASRGSPPPPAAHRALSPPQPLSLRRTNQL